MNWNMLIVFWGIMFKEAYIFMLDVWFSDRYPEIRCLFLMTLCAIISVIIWVSDKFDNIECRFGEYEPRSQPTRMHNYNNRNPPRMMVITWVSESELRSQSTRITHSDRRNAQMINADF